MPAAASPPVTGQVGPMCLYSHLPGSLLHAETADFTATCCYCFNICGVAFRRSIW